MASRIRASSSAGPQVCSTTSSMPQSWATTARPPSVTIEQDGHVGAGGADQPAQVAGVGELLAAVDEQQVAVGRLEQRAALGGQDLDRWPSSARPGSTSTEGCRALVSSSRVLMGLLRRRGPIRKNIETWPPATRTPRGDETADGRDLGPAAGRRRARRPARRRSTLRRRRGPLTLAAGRRARCSRAAPSGSRPVLAGCSVLVGDQPVATPRPGRRPGRARRRRWSSCRRSPAADPGVRNASAPRRCSADVTHRSRGCCSRRRPRGRGLRRCARAWRRRSVPGHPPRSGGVAPAGRRPPGPVTAAGAGERAGRHAARRRRWASGRRCCSSPRAFCAPCRRHAPGPGRGRRPGARGRGTSRSTRSTTCDLVRRLGVLRTPTTWCSTGPGASSAGPAVPRAASRCWRRWPRWPRSDLAGSRHDGGRGAEAADARPPPRLLAVPRRSCC